MGGQRLICSISSHIFHKGQQAYLIVCAPLAPARQTEHHMSPTIKVTTCQTCLWMQLLKQTKYLYHSKIQQLIFSTIKRMGF